MSKSHQSLLKWIPPEAQNFEKILYNARELKFDCWIVISRICVVITSLRNQNIKTNGFANKENEVQLQDMEDIYTSLETIVTKWSEIISNLKIDIFQCSIQCIRIKHVKEMLWNIKLKLTYILENYITQVTNEFDSYGERLISLTLKVAMLYNTLLSLDKTLNINMGNTNICINTCSYLMSSLKKKSVTGMLQSLAASRAELCCHKLIDGLLETYKMYDNDTDDDASSDNSSLEIYLALTKHMSPCAEVEKPLEKNDSIDVCRCENFSDLDDLISSEAIRIVTLLKTALKSAPYLLGNGIVKTNNNGEDKLRKKSQLKILEYYEQILWAEVGNYLEHVILWWTPSPLFTKPPNSSQRLREWINQFLPSANLVTSVSSALMNLADGLGVFVTSTSWDKNFRIALVGSRLNYNSESGKLFSNVLQDLVTLCNQCEVTADWVMGAPLDELPLVEQIPVFHRLDHSVHTTRLWAVNECKKLGNIWNVKSFFSITHRDIVDCLSQLNSLKLRDHSLELQKPGLGIHVKVCAIMRAKLTSEVKVNIEKLKATPKECIDGLASTCKTICLANLKMIFPQAFHWNQKKKDIPELPSLYVEKYLGQILSPVVQATHDHVICNMILTLLCESWLEHIYQNKFHFSHFGACQLLQDFAYVYVWINECKLINESLGKKLKKNEVLKRCEGVGKLLLRNPGEKLKMVEKHKRKISGGDSSEETQQELMPAEMYVPNQKKWLDLKANKESNKRHPGICCGPIC